MLSCGAITAVLSFPRGVQVQLLQKFLSQPQCGTQELRDIQHSVPVGDPPKLIVSLRTKPTQVV